jgi:kynurenine formamidase
LSQRNAGISGKGSPVIGPVAFIVPDGYRETHIELDSHLGTHIDAPAHMLEEGKFLDDFPVDQFIGKAIVVSVPQLTKQVEKSLLEERTDDLRMADYVLFKTGWSEKWGTDAYFRSFPILSDEALAFLLTFNLKGIGLDAISVDPVDSTEYPVHYALFRKGLLIVENLKFPTGFAADSGEFFCLPLNFVQADGAPVRALFRT